MRRTLFFTLALCCLLYTTQAQTPTPTQALKKAILKNDAPTAETLLTAGADPNAVVEVVPGFPTTYLITAASNNSLALVQLLLKHKAQVNQADGFKATALMAAVGKGSKAIVELLLASGADAKAKDDEGKDALTLAKAGGNPEIVTLLEQKLK
ncbi:ankyrin repeat domain-containing protein [Hymenobacter terrenus]|uniref:ankyrin repeat domain-containing protein n=1 Tax=Hymenobacter terrenus TaxID=1629124 RepID=UPI0018CE895E|nr:ankyrin repeat domain-containing protein [Hymenobacter terrenus]